MRVVMLKVLAFLWMVIAASEVSRRKFEHIEAAAGSDVDHREEKCGICSI
jgi:hypothetical protein